MSYLELRNQGLTVKQQLEMDKPKSYDVRLKALQSELDKGLEAIRELDYIRATLLVNYKNFNFSDNEKTIDILTTILEHLHQQDANANYR